MKRGISFREEKKVKTFLLGCNKMLKFKQGILGQWIFGQDFYIITVDIVCKNLSILVNRSRVKIKNQKI